MKARLPQGYGGGGPGNIQHMMQKAQKMQEQMKEKQEELNETEFTSSSGGGMVEAAVNGKREVVSLKIKPEAVDPDDIEMLEDLVIAAINGALASAEEKTSAEMEKITGGLSGMGIPGMM
jgi:DNA-binding YbaB/EbfC family protein